MRSKDYIDVLIAIVIAVVLINIQGCTVTKNITYDYGPIFVSENVIEIPEIPEGLL